VVEEQMEDPMFKHLLIGAALTAIAMGSAKAQHREATFQKMEIPGASFDIVVVTAKPGGWTFDPRIQPDAYLGGIVHMGRELVHPLTEQVLETFSNLSLLSHPACTFRAESTNGKSATPAVVYVVPRSE
jgi:hypothetical protein